MILNLSQLGFNNWLSSSQGEAVPALALTTPDGRAITTPSGTQITTA